MTLGAPNLNIMRLRNASASVGASPLFMGIASIYLVMSQQITKRKLLPNDDGNMYLISAYNTLNGWNVGATFISQGLSMSFGFFLHWQLIQLRM